MLLAKTLNMYNLYMQNEQKKLMTYLECILITKCLIIKMLNRIKMAVDMRSIALT